MKRRKLLWILGAIGLCLPMLAIATDKTDDAALVMQAQILWAPEADGFGGLSGLEILDNGARLLTVSDHGRIFDADINRQDGELRALTLRRQSPLHDTKGAPPRPFLQNAEALARHPDGRAYVAYEGWPRVWVYDQIDGLPTWTHRWDRFWDLLGNTGLEALAIDDAGQLLAISEMPDPDSGAFPVHRYDGDTWDLAFLLPAAGGFLPSGADFGPDGALYVLERRFRWYRGFATRIRRLTLGPDGITTDTRLLETSGLSLGNSEGISVWRDPSGQLRITLVSDDNFNVLQDTRITEFILTDPRP